MGWSPSCKRLSFTESEKVRFLCIFLSREYLCEIRGVSWPFQGIALSRANYICPQDARTGLPILEQSPADYM